MTTGVPSARSHLVLSGIQIDGAKVLFALYCAKINMPPLSTMHHVSIAALQLPLRRLPVLDAK